MTSFAERVLALQTQDEIQALVQNPRKRSRRVERQWRQYGYHLLVKIVAEPLLLLSVPVFALQEVHAGLCHLWEQHVVQKSILLFYEIEQAMQKRVKDLLRGQLFRPRCGRSDLDALFEAGNPYLKEFVQVRAGDTQKAQALKQRNSLILSLRKHALVELEQAQLAINVQIRRWQDRCVHGSLDRKRPISIATCVSSGLVDSAQNGGSAGARDGGKIAGKAVDSAHRQPGERNCLNPVRVQASRTCCGNGHIGKPFGELAQQIRVVGAATAYVYLPSGLRGLCYRSGNTCGRKFDQRRLDISRLIAT